MTPQHLGPGEGSLSPFQGHLMSTVDLLRESGVGPRETPPTLSRPYAPSMATDATLRSLGAVRNPGDRPMFESARLVPHALTSQAHMAQLIPRTPVELALGRALRADGPREMGEDSAGEFLQHRLLRGAGRVAKSMLDSFNPFEEGLTGRQRVFRGLNVASLALPLGVGSAALRGAAVKIFPGLNGALQTVRGKIMLTAIAEAGVSGSIEAVNDEEGRSVTLAALAGGIMGGGAAALLARASRRATAKATAQMAEDFQNGFLYASRHDNPFATATDWAILTGQEEGTGAALRAANATDVQKAAIAQRGLQQQEVLADMLSERGFHPVAVTMSDGRDAWLVPGMTARDAASTAKALGAQDQVMTKAGLLDLKAGVLHPVTPGGEYIGEELVPWIDRHISIKVKDGFGNANTINVAHRVDTIEPVRWGWGPDLTTWAQKAGVHRPADLFDETVVSKSIWQRFAQFDTKAVLSRVYQQMVDGLHGAAVLDDMLQPGLRARAAGGMKGAEQLVRGEVRLASTSVAKMIQRLNGAWSGATEVGFRHGIRDWYNPEVEFRAGARGLFQIFEDFIPTAEMDAFLEYAAVRRWGSLAAANRPVPISEGFIQMTRDNPVKHFDDALAEITQWQNDWLDNTLVRTGVISKAQRDAIINAPGNDIFIPLVRTKRGRLPRHLDDLDGWNLDLDDSGIFNVDDPIRRVAVTDVHSGQRWHPWLEELMVRSGMYARMAAQQETFNMVAAQLGQYPQVMSRFMKEVDVAIVPGLSGAMVKVRGSDVIPPIVKNSDGIFMQSKLPGSGFSRWFKFEDTPEAAALVESLEMLGPNKAALAVQSWGKTSELAYQAMTGVAAIQRAGTTLSQDFVGKNVARDVMFALTAAGVHPTNFLRGATDILWNTSLGGVISPARHTRAQALIDTFMASGGARAALVSMDRKYFRRLVTEGTERGVTMRGVVSAANPLRLLQAFSETAESATRIGSFRQRMKQLGQAAVDGDLPGLTPSQIVQEAAIYSRNASVDFGIHGSSTLAQGISGVTAFWNATLQGSREIVQAIEADPLGVTRRAMTAITLPSVLLYLHNRKDPDYGKLPDYERDLFWHIKRPPGLLGDDADDPTDDRWLRVAKPFEVGIFFGSFVERFLEFADKEDPEFLDEATATLASRLTEGYTPWPTAGQPWLDVVANRASLTEAPIVPEGMKDVDPEYHGGSAFAHAMANFLNAGEEDTREKISPEVIDHYVRGYTGQLGVMATDLTDYMINAAQDASGSAVPRPETELIDKLPFVRSFVSPFPTGAQTVTDAYNLAEEARIALRTMQSMEDAARIDDLMDVALMSRGQRLRGLAPHLEEMTANITEMRKSRERVLSSPMMSPQDKRKALYQIDRGIITYTSEMVRAARQLGLEPEDPSVLGLSTLRKMMMGGR